MRRKTQFPRQCRVINETLGSTALRTLYRIYFTPQRKECQEKSLLFLRLDFSTKNDPFRNLKKYWKNEKIFIDLLDFFSYNTLA